MKKFFVIVIALLAMSTGGIYAGFRAVDDTYWAPGYEEKNFNTAEIGMSMNDVRALVGVPLTVWNRKYYGEKGQPSFEVWDYTKSPNDSHYSMRQIEFDDNGLVRKKINEFWWD